jgi:hypothetical protein
MAHHSRDCVIEELVSNAMVYELKRSMLIGQNGFPGFMLNGIPNKWGRMSRKHTLLILP